MPKKPCHAAASENRGFGHWELFMFTIPSLFLPNGCFPGLAAYIIHTRCPEGSTNQAYSSGFYLRISWKF